jgi:hypothetical protein
MSSAQTQESLTVPETFAAQFTGPTARQSAPIFLADMPDVREAVEALGSIEAKIESGLPNGDRVLEFDELNVALSALDEVLETQGMPDLRAQLRAIRVRYEQAEELWTACLTDSKVYRGELIPLKKGNIATLLALEVLTEFPELNQSFVDGGARSPDQNWASRSRLLSALGADARAQGKRLRTTLITVPVAAAKRTTDCQLAARLDGPWDEGLQREPRH